MLPSPTRIVLLRPGALGDALLAFPALAWLRRAWPGTHLTLVARAEVLALAAAAGLADATSSFDDPIWRALWAEGDAIGALSRALSGADAVVAWLRDRDGAVARALHAAGVARMVVAPGQPPEDEREHVALYLARTLAPLGLTSTPVSVEELGALLPPIVPAAGNVAGGPLWDAWRLDGARVVALHPGSGGAVKRWPTERFAVVAARLRRAGYAPLVIEGPADRESVSRLLAAYSQEVATSLPVARDLTVEALASVLARCAGYLGNDSGVTHLAAVVGCPVLALFGPTDPMRWAPIGRRIGVLRGPHGAMESIEVEVVLDGMRQVL